MLASCVVEFRARRLSERLLAASGNRGYPSHRVHNGHVEARHRAPSEAHARFDS